MKRFIIIGLLLNICSSIWAPHSPYPFDGSFMKAQLAERERGLAASQAFLAHAQAIAQQAQESQWRKNNSPASSLDEKDDSEDSYEEPLTTAMSERTPSKVSEDSVFKLEEDTGEEEVSLSALYISPPPKNRTPKQPVLFTFSPVHEILAEKKQLEEHTQNTYDRQRAELEKQTIRIKK